MIGSSTNMFKDPGSEPRCRSVSKSEALAEDLELICTEASEHGIIEHISGGTGLYPAVFTAYIMI